MIGDRARDAIARAYPLSQRRAHADSHIMTMAAIGQLETTQSRHIVRTYGLPESVIDELKALKAQFRNELSFSGGDK
jgi:hypothetical protein